VLRLDRRLLRRHLHAAHRVNFHLFYFKHPLP
jgi:hypothetical protein